jgi:hypothetical protein
VRRSTRVRLQVPVLVTSLDPIVPFSQRCETVVVNCHGAAVTSSQAIANGTPVLLQVADNRQAMAKVVGCVADGGKFTVALKLDRAGNFWNIQPCPKDWQVAPDAAKPAAKPAAAPPPPSQSPTSSKLNAWPLAAPTSPASPPAETPKPELAIQADEPQPPQETSPAAPSMPPAPVKPAAAKLTQSQPPAEPRSPLQPELQQTVQKFKGELRRLMEENLKVMAAQTEALEEKIQGVAKLKGEIGVWLKVVPELVQEQISRVREEARTEISQELRSIVADNWERMERQVSDLAEKAGSLAHSEAANEEAVRKQVADAIREELATAGETGASRASPEIELAPLQAQVNELVAQLGTLQGLRGELQQLRESMSVSPNVADLQEAIRQAARQEATIALDEFGLARQISRVENATAEQISNLAGEIRRDADSRLQSATEQLGAQIQSAVAGATTPLRDETAALARKLAEQDAAGEQRYARFQEDFAKQLKPLLEQATEQARAQLQAALGEAVAPLRQENSGLAQRLAAVDAAGEERVTRIREEVTHYLEPLIQDAAEKARKQFEAALADAVAPVHRQTAEFGDRVADITEIGRHAAEQVQRIPELIASNSDALRQDLSAQLQAELQAQTAGLKTQAEKAASEQRNQSTAAAALMQELANARDNLNGLLQAAPAKIEAVIRDSVAAALAGMQGEAREQIRSQLRAEADELQSNLRKVAEEAAARMHQELIAGLQQRAEQTFREQHAALARELGQHLEETARRASGAVESGLRVLCASLEQRLSDQSAAQQEQWRASQISTTAEITALKSQLAEQVEQAKSDLARLQLEWGARGEQIIGEILDRTHTELRESLESMQRAQLSQARAETEQALAPMLSRAGSITNDLRTALASVDAEQNRAKLQLSALRKEREELQGWLTQRKEEFHRSLHDALVEATGEVKGRVNLAAEMLEERMRQTGEEAGLRLRGIAEHQAQELDARLKSSQEVLAASAGDAEARLANVQRAHEIMQQEFHSRLANAQAALDAKQHQFEVRICDAQSALQASRQDIEHRLNSGREELKRTEEEAKKALAASLEAQQVQAIDNFRAAAEQASADALARWQADISEKLRIVQQILSGNK